MGRSTPQHPCFRQGCVQTTEHTREAHIGTLWVPAIAVRSHTFLHTPVRVGCDYWFPWSSLSVLPVCCIQTHIQIYASVFCRVTTDVWSLTRRYSLWGRCFSIKRPPKPGAVNEVQNPARFFPSIVYDGDFPFYDESWAIPGLMVSRHRLDTSIEMLGTICEPMVS